MRIALDLAREGGGDVNPNPLVGAIVVAGNEIIGQGYHREFGGPHAEVFALEQAGDAARGATLYVTLEPCAHHGKRPPCTERIIEAGIARVVIACHDPNPLVNGAGVAALHCAGIAVTNGILDQDARKMNEIFFKFITTKIPFVQLKLATSLDGKIATRTSDSQWISGEASRIETHRLRRRFAAIVVGLGTVVVDDPQLTVRHVSGKDPIRIVLDGRGQIPLTAKLLRDDGRTIITTATMSEEKAKSIHSQGADVWRLPGEGDAVDLHALLQRLGEEGIDSLLIEGGGETAAAFLENGLIDKLSLFIAPILIGGRTAIPAIGGIGVDRIAEAIRPQRVEVEQIGADLLITGYFDRDP